MLECVKKNTAVWLFEIKQKEKKEIDQCTGVHGDGAVAPAGIGVCRSCI